MLGLLQLLSNLHCFLLVNSNLLSSTFTYLHYCPPTHGTSVQDFSPLKTKWIFTLTMITVSAGILFVGESLKEVYLLDITLMVGGW